MIRVEYENMFNLEGAIRGMRNPLASWDKSDSEFYPWDESSDEIGENDMNLMRRLYKAGSEHRKYLRQIFVSMDITAPLYWWKEFDTYKVGTVANSCSTMHKIHAKPFVLDDFSWEHLLNTGCDLFEQTSPDGLFHTQVQPLFLLADYIIPALNTIREKYLETSDKEIWWQMIQLLPTSYNQKRTVSLNYEVLLHMYQQRKNHKLDEWVNFCRIIKKELPYSEFITLEFD